MAERLSDDEDISCPKASSVGGPWVYCFAVRDTVLLHVIKSVLAVG